MSSLSVVIRINRLSMLQMSSERRDQIGQSSILRIRSSIGSPASTVCCRIGGHSTLLAPCPLSSLFLTCSKPTKGVLVSLSAFIRIEGAKRCTKMVQSASSAEKSRREAQAQRAVSCYIRLLQGSLPVSKSHEVRRADLCNFSMRYNWRAGYRCA